MTTSRNADAKPLKLERVTVNLVPKTAKALAEGTAQAELSKTDFINRAIQAMAFLEDVTANGGTLLIRWPGGDVDSVKLI